MHHFHLRPIQGIDNKTCSIHSLTFLWYEKTPLFQGFQRESFKQERLCFEKRARRGALRPFDTSLFLACETMQFASSRDTNRPEFALLISTGPFAVSFICLWSIHASLSSEAYSRNPGPAFAGFAPADFTATWSIIQQKWSVWQSRPLTNSWSIAVIKEAPFWWEGLESLLSHLHLLHPAAWPSL